MRSNAVEYDLVAGGSVDAVLRALAESDGALTPIAGGTELMVALGAGRLPKKTYISIGGLRELRFIEVTDTSVRIGSGTTFTDLRRSKVIASEFPLLAQTASWTGSIANQNRGTVGGNIANASPAADNPPAFLVYEAEIELVSARGVRTMPYAEFHLGYKKTVLAPDELIQAVRLPRKFAGYTHWVRKVGTRNAQAISKVAIAIVARVHGTMIEKISIGAASLQDKPARLYATEHAIAGKTVSADVIAAARAAVASESAPIDDIRSTAKYRVAVAQNLVEEFLLVIQQ